AFGFERFRIHVNNRMLLNGLLEELGLVGKTAIVLLVLDKLPKIGPDKVQALLTEEAGVGGGQAQRLLTLVQTRGKNTEILDQVEKEFGENNRLFEGVARLRQLLEVATTAGLPDDRLNIDLSIARGLYYYT